MRPAREIGEELLAALTPQAARLLSALLTREIALVESVDPDCSPRLRHLLALKQAVARLAAWQVANAEEVTP